MAGVMGNLPLDIATFVGREAEVARARRLLSRTRLVTLTGPGGVGKTRLALRIAEAARQTAPDGAWMVDMGTLHRHAAGRPSPTLPPEPASSAERLYAHLALALGIRHHGAAGPEAVLNHLRGRRILLVLDTCEYLVPEIRTCVSTLLHSAPHLRILATSRRTLGVEGEHNLVVPPLPLPDAVTLFRTYATAAGADPAALADTAAVEDLCRRLDGLPLAIRLAAGRARVLSLQQLLHRLSNRFGLLTDTGTAHRHATLEQVVAWSYALCTEQERQVWARAAVFAHSFDLPAAEAVAAAPGMDPATMLDTVTGLVDKSVLTVAHTAGRARYAMLDTLREYGLRKLSEADETHRVRDLHRDYYSDLIAQAAATWLSPTELDTMATVHQELPELLSAIDHSLTTNTPAPARAICRDLVRVRAPFFWGYLDLIAQQLTRVLTASLPHREPAATPDLATALGVVPAPRRPALEHAPGPAVGLAPEPTAGRTPGPAVGLAPEPTAGRAHGPAASPAAGWAPGPVAGWTPGPATGWTLRPAAGWAPGSDEEAADLAATAATACWVAVAQGRHDTARALLADARELLRLRGITTTAPVLFAQGAAEVFLLGGDDVVGVPAAARAAFHEPGTAGDQHMATMIWAIAHAVTGEPAAAVAASREHLRQAEQARAPWAISWALWTGALSALHSGDHGQAAALVGRCLRLHRDMDDQWGQTWSLELCAWTIAAQLDRAPRSADEARRAAWLLGAAQARQRRLGVTLAGLRPFAEGRTRARARIATVLTEATIGGAMAAGARGQAHALRVALGEPTPRRPTASTRDGLTDREREVAMLVAAGLTSAEIGAQLRIGRRTVDTHVRNLMAKLGMHRRAAIAAWAASRATQQPR